MFINKSLTVDTDLYEIRNTNRNNEQQKETILLSARGQLFEIIRERLNQFPDTTRLGKLKHFNNLNHNELLNVCDNYNVETGYFYFDRDPTVLALILNFHWSSDGKLHLNNLESYCVFYLIKELEYWHIYESQIDLCCKFKLQSLRTEAEMFSRASIQDYFDSKTQENEQLGHFKYIDRCKISLREILENPHSSMFAKVIISCTY